MREYSATVGATDGNIIAAIITTHTDRNQPNVPRSVHGPLSMPRIRPAVHHQPTAASTTSSATSPRRARTAAYAGRNSLRARRGESVAVAADDVIGSGRPGEVGLRECRLTFVLDAEGVDPR